MRWRPGSAGRESPPRVADNAERSDATTRRSGSAGQSKRWPTWSGGPRREGTSIAHRFDFICEVLRERGHLSGWEVTDTGRLLGRVYHEADLLVTDTLVAGLFDGLSPPELASLVSCFTYEHRRPSPPPEPWFPSKTAAQRYRDVERLARDLSRAEGTHGVPQTRSPEAGFAPIAHAWAAGEDLRSILAADDELSAGDFVRNVKQLLDLLSQLSHVAPTPGDGPGRAHCRRCHPPRRGRGVRCRRGAMTIERGVDWGEPGDVPPDAVFVVSDLEAAAVVTEARRSGAPIPPICLLGGDLARTVGAGGDSARLRRGEGTRLSVDVGAALVDGRLYWFVAHLVARRSWWRGRIVVAANAAFIGRWNVAPRAHPGDGRLELLDGDPPLSDRWKARRRLPAGTHLPHPAITTRRVDAAQFEFERPTPIHLDGTGAGTARVVSVRVEADALQVWI